jgi:uncharacterized membrane protein
VAINNPGAGLTSPFEVSADSRYIDAYRVAHVMTRLSRIIKILGIVLGLITGGITGYTALSMQMMSPFGSIPLVLAGILEGIVVWISAYVIATVVAALGYILMASLDSAVNTSRLVAEDGRGSQYTGSASGDADH